MREVKTLTVLLGSTPLEPTIVRREHLVRFVPRLCADLPPVAFPRQHDLTATCVLTFIKCVTENRGTATRHEWSATLWTFYRWHWSICGFSGFGVLQKPKAIKSRPTKYILEWSIQTLELLGYRWPVVLVRAYVTPVKVQKSFWGERVYLAYIFPVAVYRRKVRQEPGGRTEAETVGECCPPTWSL